MKLTSDSQRQSKWPIALAIASGLIFLAMIIRNTGLYASVFGDEWTYSASSRLALLAKSSIPSYLYLWVYRLTNTCGIGFLECARLLNSAFFIAATPFLYLSFRRFTRPSIAAVLALVSICGPINTFTAYFMPESMYFFVFWAFFYFALMSCEAPSIKSSLMIGAILGLACLIKVHGLFLLGAYSLFKIISIFTWPPQRRFKNAARELAVIWATCLLVRLLMGYALAGQHGLNLFGDFYLEQAHRTETRSPINEIIHNAIISGFGHILAICLMIGPLLVGFMSILLSPRVESSDSRKRVTILCLSILGVLVAITAYFTGTISAGPSAESVYRLHLRYYDFCLPAMLLGVLAGHRSRAYDSKHRWLLIVFSIVVAAITLAGTAKYLHDYTPFLVDAPELVWITGHTNILMFTGIAGALSTLFYAISRNRFKVPIAMGYCCLFTLISIPTASRELATRANPDAYARAGALARMLYPDSIQNSQFIGNDALALYKARFNADAIGADVMQLSAGAKLDPAINNGKDVTVAFNDIILPAGSYATEYDFDGFRIYKTCRSNWIDFSSPEHSDLVQLITGLSSQESFGRWSDGPRVTIDLTQPLPDRVTLTFTAAAYGENAKIPFQVAIGKAIRPVSIGDSVSSHELSFEGVANEREITFLIPKPVSPYELGVSADRRLLGIALKDMEIVPAVASADTIKSIHYCKR
jgi:phosphoglycerol transferase